MLARSVQDIDMLKCFELVLRLALIFYSQKK